MGVLKTEWLNDHIININESDESGLNVDSYLILGSRNAVVVDALQDNEDLLDTVRSFTDKPLSLLLTHGHPDHAGKSCRKFVEAGIPVYMNENDACLLFSFAKGEWTKKIIPLKERDTFDLGERKIISHVCPGHTQGSFVFFDEKYHELFSGDAIGSGGFWMQLSHSSPLHSYLLSVERLYNMMKPYSDLKIYFGHRYQTSYIPSLEYIEDNIEATKKIISGELHAEKQTMQLGEEKITFCSVSYGLIHDYCFDPEKI